MLNRADRRRLARDIASQMAQGAVDLSAPAERSEPVVVTLAEVGGTDVKFRWHQAMLEAIARAPQVGIAFRSLPCESGPHLDKARNMLVRRFLQSDDPYLLFVDTDIVFTATDVKLLLEADAPIAGALYFTAALGMEPWPTALEWATEEAESAPEEGSEDPYALSGPRLVPIALPEPPENLTEGDGTALAEWVQKSLEPRAVDAVGAGLLLIKREVVEALAEAHNGRPFAFDAEHDRGEDVTFCLRAKELGFETVLVPQARVGHVKAALL